MDMTGMKIMGEPLDVANRIRERIKNELGYTVSIGISTNKLLAKMASDMRKPDAEITLYPYEIPEKLWPMPIEDLYLVGPATGPKLRNMGIETIGDLAKWDKELLRYKFKSFADVLWDYANGIEDSLIAGSVSSIIKGIGNSMTAHYDVVDRQDAHLMLLSLVETVGMRLRHSGFSCRVISVSPRKADDLRWYSHQRKIMVPTDNTNEIYEHCVSLFDECWKGEPLRGMGIRTSDLHTSDCIQLSLFSKDLEKQRSIDKAIDQIRKRYGPMSVIRSSFLYSGLSPLQGGVSEDASFPVMTSIL
jgi:DNA polymerase-4